MILMWKVIQQLHIGEICASWLSNQPQETMRACPKFPRVDTTDQMELEGCMRYRLTGTRIGYTRALKPAVRFSLRTREGIRSW